MDDNANDIGLELSCVIVNFGLGSKVLKIAKLNGMLGGTVFLGMGTIKNRLLDLLDLGDIRKEIVLMISGKKTTDTAIEALSKEMAFNKPNHGIAFTTSVISLIGSKKYNHDYAQESKGGDNIMYNAIFVVVDKGNAEAAIDAATNAGSRGATIINARGSGIHETHMLFSMPIEPEKEIVLILSDSALTDAIVDSIRKTLDIDTPGNGVMFILDVNKTYGLY